MRLFPMLLLPALANLTLQSNIDGTNSGRQCKTKTVLEHHKQPQELSKATFLCVLLRLPEPSSRHVNITASWYIHTEIHLFEAHKIH